MSKIEEVARAIDPMSAKVADMLLAKGLSHKDVLAILPMDKARAAIEAMRPASDAMTVAGGLKCEALMFEGEGSGNVIKDMGMVFDAMIDVALSEVKG